MNTGRGQDALPSLPAIVAGWERAAWWELRAGHGGHSSERDPARWRWAQPRKKRKTKEENKIIMHTKEQSTDQRCHLRSPQRANATIKRLREEQDQILKEGQSPARALQNALSETGSLIFFSLPGLQTAATCDPSSGEEKMYCKQPEPALACLETHCLLK